MKPITLWRDEATSCDPERWRTYKVDDYQAEYAALPRADFDALVKERDGLRDAVATKDRAHELSIDREFKLQDEVDRLRATVERAVEALRAPRNVPNPGSLLALERARADAASERLARAEALLREAADSGMENAPKLVARILDFLEKPNG